MCDILMPMCILTFGAFYQESDWYVAQATRWFDGLVNMDIQITNEVYSVQGVDFDRQVIKLLCNIK